MTITKEQVETIYEEVGAFIGDRYAQELADELNADCKEDDLYDWKAEVYACARDDLYTQECDAKAHAQFLHDAYGDD